MKFLRSVSLALAMTVAFLAVGNVAYANSPATFATTSIVKGTSLAMPATELAFLKCSEGCAAWIAAAAGAVAAGAAVVTAVVAVAAAIDSSSSSSASGSIHFEPPSQAQTALAQRTYVDQANRDFDR